jgi:hypothetical protein
MLISTCPKDVGNRQWLRSKALNYRRNAQNAAIGAALQGRISTIFFAGRAHRALD